MHGNGEESFPERCAGILMHISSLPGPAYIGDIGPAAREFAEFLHRAHQSVWQLLPVQPTGPDQGYSPYSASSALAGNPLLISPELLLKDGLIEKKDIKKPAGGRGRVNYDKAKSYKEKLLNKAFDNWEKKATEADKTAFTEFCVKENYWLNDFAFYTLLKSQHKQLPWYEWPAGLRDREPGILQKVSLEFEEELDRIKWIQMIFDRQWTAFHKYCDALQIRLLGDVPIYVGHDSADVWTNRHLFTLDEFGKLTDVAGVPPDLFNDNGQLWGMPLYKWDVVHGEGYDWWVKRLRKNLDWFDVIRLDHFRGFASFWSVTATEKTAKNGNWVTGPGSSFFEKIREELGALPFVAEDLGEIDKPVYQLRDEFNLPGMNVLQFAFGDDMPKSGYLPHNYIQNSIVYTGTHDNNTTVGWFKSAGKEEKNNLSEYAGTKVTAVNVVEHMARLAYMSVSKVAILPLQDVLSLDESARMNMPATVDSNWTWRLKEELLNKKAEEKLRQWCFLYDRN